MFVNFWILCKHWCPGYWTRWVVIHHRFTIQQYYRTTCCNNLNDSKTDTNMLFWAKEIHFAHTMKNNLKSDGQPFHQYQQNELSPLFLTHWIQKPGNDIWCFKSGLDLGQAQKCGRVKSVNGIQTLWMHEYEKYAITIKHTKFSFYLYFVFWILFSHHLLLLRQFINFL
jgi:hypothetical protein